MNKTELARELIRKYPKLGVRSLSRILYKENRELFLTENAASLSVRRATGSAGKQNRAKILAKDVRREVNKWEPTQCPKSKAEPWVPFVIERPERTLILSDIHVPFHDEVAVKAAVKEGKRRNPTTVLLNGDVIDFYAISRYEKNPKHRDLRGEIDLTKQFLKWIRCQFPKSDIIYKVGNHDFRWDAYIWAKAPELWNIVQCQLHAVLEFESLGITRVDDNPITIGALPVLHGHELPRTISNPVNPARGAFLRTLTSILISHLHQTSSHSENSMKFLDEAVGKKEIMTWSTGCLCELTPPYARVNKWCHGFAFVETAPDSTYNVTNFRVTNGNVRSS